MGGLRPAEKVQARSRVEQPWANATRLVLLELPKDVGARRTAPVSGAAIWLVKRRKKLKPSQSVTATQSALCHPPGPSPDVPPEGTEAATLRGSVIGIEKIVERNSN